MAIYLVHFWEPFKHAQHYLGFTADGEDVLESVEKRLDRHRSGRGSVLLRHVSEAGIKFSVVRVWPGLSRNAERSLKNRRDNKRICPVCNVHTCWRNGVFNGNSKI